MNAKIEFLKIAYPDSYTKIQMDIRDGQTILAIHTVLHPKDADDLRKYIHIFFEKHHFKKTRRFIDLLNSKDHLTVENDFRENYPSDARVWQATGIVDHPFF